MWPETHTAKVENRHELVLSGSDISRRIDQSGDEDGSDGFDNDIFTLVSLNFLEVSRTSLSKVTNGIGQLVNMQNLVLRNNALQSLPDSLGNMTKLKFLDISGNQLTELPDCISNLSELYTLNASMNQLTQVFVLTAIYACIELIICKFGKIKIIANE